MTRGGFLTNETARRLGDVLRSLKARVGALEGKSGTSGFSTQRDDLYIAIPQGDINPAMITPTQITPTSEICDLFVWRGAVLVKRGTQKVYNLRAETIPAGVPIAIHREWTGGKFFAMQTCCQTPSEVVTEIGADWGQAAGGSYHKKSGTNWTTEPQAFQITGDTRWMSWAMHNFPWGDVALYDAIRLQLLYEQWTNEMAPVAQPWQIEIYALKIANPMWSGGGSPLPSVPDAAWSRTVGVIVNLDDAPVNPPDATQWVDVTAIMDELVPLALTNVAWIIKPLWDSGDLINPALMEVRLSPSELENPYGITF